MNKYISREDKTANNKKDCCCCFWGFHFLQNRKKIKKLKTNTPEGSQDSRYILTIIPRLLGMIVGTVPKAKEETTSKKKKEKRGKTPACNKI
jgi:hypothetical protein